MKKREMKNALNARYYKARSNWNRGVVAYALELVYGLDDDEEITEKVLLNGARNWHEYSEGGASLIYDADICLRLSAPWEIKRKRGGALPPNSKETWLDVQARALHQAASLIMRIENDGY